MCLLYYMHECCCSSSSEDKKDLEVNRSNKAKRKRRKKPFWIFLSRSHMVNTHIVTVTAGLYEEFGLVGWFLKLGYIIKQFP
ncbi:hypothetical protein NC651_040012 [Populus alba x Populus x berolinensis]|nr:hypothetical protein NC651_040012 [Populus alba x Populus x berolinensis]